MAYSIKGNAIINDSRALLGVSTAGINTALYVGDVKIDALEGEITSVGANPVIYRGDGSNLTGVVTVTQDGGGGGTPTFEGSLVIEGDINIGGIATIGSNLDLNNSDIINGGTGNFADLVVSGTTTLGTALSFTSGTAGEVATGITTDLDISAGATELVTAEGAKSYVDSKIGGGSLLEIEGDNGVQGEIDLANDEVFGLAGTANQIDSNIAGVGFNTVTFTLSNELQLPGTLAFGAAGQAVSVVGVETSLVDGVAGVATNTSLPTQLAVKTYVDAQIAETGGSVSFTGDSGSGSFDISDEVFNILGTTNQVVTSGAGLTVTVALADSVDINPTSVVGGGLRATGITTLRSAQGLPSAAEVILEIDQSARVAGDINLGGTLNLASGLPGSNSITYQTNGGSTIIQFAGISTALNEAGTGATNSTLPTELAVKTYVDAQVGGNTNAESIDVATNQDNVVYSVPFVSATGAGVSMYSDATQLQYNPSTGLLVAQDFNSLSDIRFKENVETITGATAKLEQIRGVEFDWKNTEGSSVGVIAQEVEALYPQLVTQGEDKLTVNYNGLTGLLIEAVKELTARVAELEGKA